MPKTLREPKSVWPYQWLWLRNAMNNGDWYTTNDLAKVLFETKYLRYEEYWRRVTRDILHGLVREGFLVNQRGRRELEWKLSDDA